MHMQLKPMYDLFKQPIWQVHKQHDHVCGQNYLSNKPDHTQTIKVHGETIPMTILAGLLPVLSSQGKFNPSM